MEGIASDALLSILVSVCAAFCLGIALVLFCKHDTERHWQREKDKQMNR